MNSNMTAVQRAILYTASGGFLAIVFGLLGTASAQAAADKGAPTKIASVGKSDKKTSAAPQRKATPAPAARKNENKSGVKRTSDKSSANGPRSGPGAGLSRKSDSRAQESTPARKKETSRPSSNAPGHRRISTGSGSGEKKSDDSARKKDSSHVSPVAPGARVASRDSGSGEKKSGEKKAGVKRSTDRSSASNGPRSGPGAGLVRTADSRKQESAPIRKKESSSEKKDASRLSPSAPGYRVAVGSGEKKSDDSARKKESSSEKKDSSRVSPVAPGARVASRDSGSGEKKSGEKKAGVKRSTDRSSASNGPRSGPGAGLVRTADPRKPEGAGTPRNPVHFGESRSPSGEDVRGGASKGGAGRNTERVTESRRVVQGVSPLPALRKVDLNSSKKNDRERTARPIVGGEAEAGFVRLPGVLQPKSQGRQPVEPRSRPVAGTVRNASASTPRIRPAQSTPDIDAGIGRRLGCVNDCGWGIGFLRQRVPGAVVTGPSRTAEPIAPDGKGGLGGFKAGAELGRAKFLDPPINRHGGPPRVIGEVSYGADVEVEAGVNPKDGAKLGADLFAGLRAAGPEQNFQRGGVNVTEKAEVVPIGLQASGEIGLTARDGLEVGAEVRGGTKVMGNKYSQDLGPLTVSTQPEVWVGPGVAAEGGISKGEDGKWHLKLRGGASTLGGGGLNLDVAADPNDLFGQAASVLGGQ